MALRNLEQFFINRSVPDVATLKALVVTSLRDGFLAVLDEVSPASLYTWSSTSTETPDGINVIKPDSVVLPAPGRWVRVGSPTDFLFKGVIGKASDFPTTAEVQVGWTYTIGYQEAPNTLTSSGTTATATVSSNFYNNYINGKVLVVGGADQANYNGSFVGTKGVPNVLTYTMTNPTSSPATGSILIATPDIVVDDDPTKTFTGQTFNNNDEPFWNGAAYSLLGKDRIWVDDGATVTTLGDKKLLIKNRATFEDNVSIVGDTTMEEDVIIGGGPFDGTLDIRDSSNVPKVSFDSGGIAEIELNTIFGQDVTVEDDIAVYNHLRVGGTGASIDGQLIVKDSVDSERVVLNSDGTPSDFEDGIDNKSNKIINVADPTLVLDAVNKQTLDAAIATFEQDQTYFVGKHGSDSNNGTSQAQAFATPQKAFDTIAALGGGATPSQTQQYLVWVVDGGTYTGSCDMISVEWTTLYAPGAYINSDNFRINQNCTVKIKEAKRLTPGSLVITKKGAGTAYLNAQKIWGGVGDGIVYMDDGTLYVDADETLADTAANSLVTTNPLNTCEFFLSAGTAKGSITVGANGTGHVDMAHLDGDVYLTGASDLYHTVKNWNTGNVLTAVAGSRIFLEVDERGSPLASDVLSSTLAYKHGKTFKRHATSSSYNPSVLTDHRLIAMTNTAAPRNVIISTEDVQSGSPAAFRLITVKDESGGAAINNITISLESGTIDGEANFPIKGNNNAITFYLDGTNAWII